MIQEKKVLMSKRKYASLSGYTFENAQDTIKSMHQHGTKGDWRRDRIIRVKIKRYSIVWSCENGTAFTIKPPVLPGMTGLVAKTQTASGRNCTSLPNSVKEYFNLDAKSSYKPEQYRVNVTFSGE